MISATENDTRFIPAVRTVVLPAILGSSLLTIVIETLLNLLGVGVGAITISGNFDSDSASALGIGAMFWFALSGTLAMLIGGWVAGYFANTRNSLVGIWHGLIMWSVVACLGLLLVSTSLGMVINGTLNMVDKGLATMGGGKQTISYLQNSPQGISPDEMNYFKQIKDEAGQLVQKAADEKNDQHNGKNSIHETVSALQENITQWLTSNDDNSRKKIKDFLITKANLDEYKAEQLLSQWQQQYQSAVATTKKIAANLGKAITLTVIVMLLGAVASAVGGMLGARANP